MVYDEDALIEFNKWCDEEEDNIVVAYNEQVCGEVPSVENIGQVPEDFIDTMYDNFIEDEGKCF